MKDLLEDPNPIGAARWQLATALGRFDAMRKYPDLVKPEPWLLDKIYAELETTLAHIVRAHHEQLMKGER